MGNWTNSGSRRHQSVASADKFNEGRRQLAESKALSYCIRTSS
jgi:hypothetical protein